MIAALRAERLKLRRSAVLRLPLLGLFIGLLQGALFLLGPREGSSWPQLIAWHTLWLTFLSPLTLALLSGLTARREVRARGGGSWWRPTSPRTLRVAEFVWLALITLCLHALVIFTALPLGLLMGLIAPPWGRLLTLVLVLWLTSLPLLALQSRLGRLLGLVGSLILGLVGAFSGVLTAEGPWWWLSPWAWPVRSTLTLSGTHANGLPLAPGDAAWHISFWPPLLLSVFVLPLLLLTELPFQTLGLRQPRLSTTPLSSSKSERSAFRFTGALGSEGLKYRHTFVPYLSLGAPILLLLAFWGRRTSVSDLWQLWTILALPFGAALLPAAAWLWERNAWRALQTRAVRPSRLYLAKLAVLWIWANVSALLFAALLWLFRGQPKLLGPLELYAAVSFFLLALNLYLALRFGPGVTLGAGTVSTLLALVLGGTDLGWRVWPFVPWTWGWLPLATHAALPFTLLALGLGALISWLGAFTAGRLEPTHSE